MQRISVAFCASRRVSTKLSELESLARCKVLPGLATGVGKNSTKINILRLVVRKSPTGESTHYFFHSQNDKVEVSC
ncbi:hypothetical protein EI220_05930 [Streptococcus suis]|uniref:Uncharacterized protein n=1 Tax=Streptococcus suis TaxID=1307 RepID=A0A3R8N108_STRSU|nr:hypothetical protein EI220_05930 [Streptococcus suis]